MSEQYLKVLKNITAKYMSYELKIHQFHLKFDCFCTIKTPIKAYILITGCVSISARYFHFSPKDVKITIYPHFNKTRADVWAGTDVTKQQRKQSKETHSPVPGVKLLSFSLSLKIILFSSFFPLIPPYLSIFKDLSYSADSRDPRSRRTVLIRNTCLQLPRCNLLWCVQGLLKKLAFGYINLHFCHLFFLRKKPAKL